MSGRMSRWKAERSTSSGARVRSLASSWQTALPYGDRECRCGTPCLAQLCGRARLGRAGEASRAICHAGVRGFESRRSRLSGMPANGHLQFAEQAWIAGSRAANGQHVFRSVPPANHVFLRSGRDNRQRSRRWLLRCAVSRNSHSLPIAAARNATGRRVVKPSPRRSLCVYLLTSGARAGSQLVAVIVQLKGPSSPMMNGPLSPLEPTGGKRTATGWLNVMS